MGPRARTTGARAASVGGMELPSFVRRRASVVFVALLLAACGAEAPPDPAPDGIAALLLAEVNEARVAGRVCGDEGAFAPTHPLALDARLTLAAQVHADDMHARGTMSHTGSDGSNPGVRIARTGYVGATWGENVAAGYPSVDAVMAGWLGSDGHCANLMNPAFTEFGAGESGRYWAQVFARPQ
jgi:uncharacterized protein YkwD